MMKKQPLSIAIIISMVVTLLVLILNWHPQGATTQSDQNQSEKSTLLASEPEDQLSYQVPNQPANKSTSQSSNQETGKVNGKDSNISSDSVQVGPSGEALVNEQKNEQIGSGPVVVEPPVVPQTPNTNSGSGETSPEQNQSEQRKQEDLFDRIERSIKEELSKASLGPSKS